MTRDARAKRPGLFSCARRFADDGPRQTGLESGFAKTRYEAVVFFLATRLRLAIRSCRQVGKNDYSVGWLIHILDGI